jgi:glycerophosphoryl diester phosphodiesterase
MAAFKNAKDLGVDFIELDVRLCATGELVVVHDADLRRVAGVDRRVDSLSLSELQSIDVGSHFHSDYADERVPTLVEVVEALDLRARTGVRLNIEVKEESARGDGSALELGRMIAEMDLYGHVVVSSFNPMALARVRSHCPAPLGLLYPSSGTGVRDRLTRRPWASSILSLYALHPSVNVVTAEGVRKAHLRGLGVNVWTVNSEAKMRELAGWQINGMITDHPDVAMNVVLELDALKGNQATL